MTRIKKLKVKNFKKFVSQTFDFNDDINILVGDNECGKSSVLEAVELCLNCCHRGKPLSPEVMSELFNGDSVDAYLEGDKSQDTLPELLIEAYLDGNPELKGHINSDGADVQGVFIRMSLDTDLADDYQAFIASGEVITIPFELYRVEWSNFAWKHLSQFSRPVTCLFVDPTRLHPTLGRSRYINSIINSHADKSARSKLNLAYRTLKLEFNDDENVEKINEKLNEGHELTAKSLKIVADITPSGSWDSNLALAVDDVPFAQIGKGEQNQIQIKIAIQNKAKDADIVMLEEPENHLSHINLSQLVSYIGQRNSGKQIFLTTHSSYVLNKLSIRNLCLLSQGYKRLQEVDSDTVEKLRRLPGYDTLRLILSQKVILVEGPSDELVLKKIYRNQHKGRLPEDDGIDIIVVRGIGFKVYLDIAKALSHAVRVVKDNDGNYEQNIVAWREKDYAGCQFIQCFSPTDNSQYSLEPSLIAANCATIAQLDALAGVMLAKPTYNTRYALCTELATKRAWLEKWYAEEKGGGRKVDSAIKLFDNDTVVVEYPTYLKEAVTFGT